MPREADAARKRKSALFFSKRRTALQQAVGAQLISLFQSCVLGFDHEVALACGRIAAKAQAAGNPIDFAATTHRFILATRDTLDFKGTRVELLNPSTSS